MIRRKQLRGNSKADGGGGIARGVFGGSGVLKFKPIVHMASS